MTYFQYLSSFLSFVNYHLEYNFRKKYYVKVKIIIEKFTKKETHPETQPYNKNKVMVNTIKNFKQLAFYYFLSELNSKNKLKQWLRNFIRKNLYSQVVDHDKLQSFQNNLIENWRKLSENDLFRYENINIKTCPFCLSKIGDESTICPLCGSYLENNEE